MANLLPVKRLSFLCHDHRHAKVAFTVSGKHLLPIGHIILTYRTLSAPGVPGNSSFGVEARVMCCRMEDEDVNEALTAGDVVKALKPGVGSGDPLYSACVCEMDDGRIYGITNTRPRLAECHGVQFLIFETEPISDQHLADFWKLAEQKVLNPFL
jgi:hypothetical protein